ncbi:hypothetical protein FQR65_LT15983 [Abscondita terminalis]|nr:hypothetical protein FQR65_LT15983 [Abscondita terminalis]
MTTVFERRSKQKKVTHKQGRVRAANNGPDKEYGPEAAKPNMTVAELSETSQKFLDILRDQVIRNELRHQLETNTRGQHENQLWRELRRNYLTAFNFGVVIKRRKNTACHNLVKIFCTLKSSTQLRLFISESELEIERLENRFARKLALR